jgi:diketogulonate reductase-like aldo/keto reductase
MHALVEQGSMFKLKSKVPSGVGWEQHVRLQDGTLMPLIGFGTQYGFTGDGHHRGSIARGSDYVALALRTGLRLVDTARCYGTEAHVMNGIERGGVSRREVFVVSKAWPGIDHVPGSESSRSAISESATRLGGYVDLYLVHHPVPGWQQLWRSLEDAKEKGLVKAIGVSNFKPGQLEELQSFARYPAVANQILLHPFVYRQQAETLRYCAEHGIVIIAYPRCPWQFGIGTAFAEIAARTGRTIVQVMLRWAIDHGCAVIPLSISKQHLEENLAIRKFRLSPRELAGLDEVADHAPLRYSIDELNSDYVTGWAFAGDGVANIQVSVEGISVGRAIYGNRRPDVAAVYANRPGALESGFIFHFPENAFKKPLCEVSVTFELANGERVATEKTVVPSLFATRASTIANDGRIARAPFPTGVLRLLWDLFGDAFPAEEDWSDEQIRAAVDYIVLLARRGSRRTEGLFGYLRYLNSVRSHAEFVARNFQRMNSGTAADAKDAVSFGSSPPEMLCIANHLYTLKSRGLAGRLLEFGCFKGFSTACLSFACQELGIGFDVFDSFQGLPPSESQYYGAGDFAGSLEEVKRNVRELGKIETVTFHKGFFSETLPCASIDPLCIWMDVDLESSSRDVMTILPALRRESCVFSHEAPASYFSNGSLTAPRGPDSPLWPIADAFARLDRPVRGLHLTGNTAAFWEHGTGIPVLPYDQLSRVLELC